MTSPEREVAGMAVRHRVTINVTGPHGRSTDVMKAADVKFPVRLLRFLFGEFTQVYLLSPGQTVESVDIREIGEGVANEGKG